MDNRPIGIFDSGLGGLTTFCELKRILPNENIIYFGDTSRVPYGTRSVETIRRYAKQDIAFLKSKNVKMIIAACNTATTVISQDDITEMALPYTGVLKPAVISAIKATKNKRIGVIGTTATIASGAYEKTLLENGCDIQVFTQACPLFVPLVENGFTQKDNEVTTLVAKQYLEKLINSNVDTLILGCTHFPIISGIISSIMGKDVCLIDSGKEAGQVALDLLKQNDSLRFEKTLPNYQFFVSDTVKHFTINAPIILNEDVTLDVTKINIEDY